MTRMTDDVLSLSPPFRFPSMLQTPAVAAWTVNESAAKLDVITAQSI